MCGIVDSDTGKPLAIFGSRYGQEIRDWLKLHQEIKVVSRDGSHSYAEIIRESLPDAIQDSDRFHLIKNLKDTMVDIIKFMLHRKFSQSLGADSLPDLSIDVRIPSVKDMRRSGRLSGSSGKG